MAWSLSLDQKVSGLLGILANPGFKLSMVPRHFVNLPSRQPAKICFPFQDTHHNDIQHNKNKLRHSAQRYSIQSVVKLNVANKPSTLSAIMLNVVMLNVAAPKELS
jgi:hypothetical protein